MPLTVPVNLGPRSYKIAVGHPAASMGAFVREALPKSRRALVVADSGVPGHADAVAAALTSVDFDVRRFVVPSGEASKCAARLAEVWAALAEWPADRQTAVVAVGGGVVGDLAGFAAATYARGLPLAMVPTTLLAMVDSSVGGKTGVNLPQGKNLVGSFHQPAAVWIDPDTLGTLPEREYRSGLAEVVKYGVILDAAFFADLERDADALLKREPDAVTRVVARSCELKAFVVERDEREETGLRACLNYGHTFAHVFESAAGYGGWLHGEAVSAGMNCAAELARRLGMIDGELGRRQRDLLARFGLPLDRDPSWDVDAMIAGMYRDKKAGAGTLRFVLPTRLGEVRLVDGVPEAEARAVLGSIP